MEFSTTTPSPSIRSDTVGSEPACSDNGINTVHQIMLLVLGARVEGEVGQFAVHSSFGTIIEVMGRQVEVPSFSTFQAKSKLAPTGWAPTPKGLSDEVPSANTT